MNKIALFLPLLVAFPGEVHARRILFASQFSLVPEAKAHLNFGFAADRELNPRSIKIMVWNLKKGQEPGLDIDLPAYGKDRDLLLISEGYLNPLVKGAFDTFRSHRWDMGVAFLYKKDNNYETGTLIGSRVNPEWVKVRQTSDREPFINTPKCLTFAKYPIAGSSKKLLAVSIHGINVVTEAAFQRHVQQAKEEILRHDGPVIFGGDFNTNLKSKVKYLFKSMGNIGMQSLDFRNDDRTRVLGNQIDYVFIRGLHPKDAEVLGQLKSSDHKAMLAELAVIEDGFTAN